MSAPEYDRTMRDLVNFLVWMGEPHQLARKRLGVWVLFALTILVFMTYFLYKSYWKDVH
jgi:ubiquinol-cytochrome c reductase cytochrome c1 subunit